jgi:hypothetical protein
MVWMNGWDEENGQAAENGIMEGMKGLGEDGGWEDER